MLKLEKTFTALDIASWFVVRNNTEAFIKDNLKTPQEVTIKQVTPIKITSLHKLLYFAQAYSLFYTDKPLFNEEIYAWQFGPVVTILQSQAQGMWIFNNLLELDLMDDDCDSQIETSKKEQFKYDSVVAELFDPINKNKVIIPYDKDVDNFIDVEENDNVNLILEKVYRDYGYKSAKELVDLTHQEDPWCKANGCEKGTKIGNKSNNVIDKEEIKNYYVNDKLKNIKRDLKETEIVNYADTRSLIHYLCDPKSRKYDLEIFV